MGQLTGEDAGAGGNVDGRDAAGLEGYGVRKAGDPRVERMRCQGCGWYLCYMDRRDYDDCPQCGQPIPEEIRVREVDAVGVGMEGGDKDGMDEG